MAKRGYIGRLVGVLTVGLGLLVTACSSTNHKAAPASNTSSTALRRSHPNATNGSTTSTTVALLASGQEGSRQDVPWLQVGEGWLLTEWAPATGGSLGFIHTGQPSGTILYLVDPLGGRYRLASGPALPQGDLVAWSGDSQRALFALDVNFDQLRRYTVMDLRTGGVSGFSLPNPPVDAVIDRKVDFTKPNGFGLIAAGVLTVPLTPFSTTGMPGTDVPVQRLNLTGTVEVSYPDFSIPSGSRLGQLGTAFLYWPDGSQLILAPQSGADPVPSTPSWSVVTNDGRFVRSVPLPPGASSCEPRRWWTTSAVLADCTFSAGGFSIWGVPVTQGAPHPLAPSGFVGTDAWRLSGAIYLTGTPCYPGGGLVRFRNDGTTQPLSLPLPNLPATATAGVIGVTGNRLAVFADAGCPLNQERTKPEVPHAGILEAFDPATGSVMTLLGGNLNGGSVNQALIHQPTPPTNGS